MGVLEETCLTLPDLDGLRNCFIPITPCFEEAQRNWKSLEYDLTCM